MPNCEVLIEKAAIRTANIEKMIRIRTTRLIKSAENPVFPDDFFNNIGHNRALAVRK